MNFSEKLISLRRAKGLSQEQLANIIDVSRQAVSKWETGESLPDLAKLILLCNTFDVSLELCGRKSESASALPVAPSKPCIRITWLCAVALVVGLALGLTGGFFSVFPGTPKQQTERVTITSLDINPQLYYQKINLVYSPSIAKDSFRYKVIKTDSAGKITSFPAVYAEGVCTCDVTVDNYQGYFTLHSVINDGVYEYTSGLVKILEVDEGGCSYNELWNK